MRKVLFTLAIALIASFSFAQTNQANEEAPGQAKIKLKTGTTEVEADLVIENDNVTVYPGEQIIITTDGTDKIIAVKGNGEYIGRVASTVNVTPSAVLDKAEITTAGVDVTGDRPISNELYNN
ncbi:MAG: hypothetical protein C0594_03515 [Marinilabiliales bacterium]|nr:MAG: hypothetical protein C0594_03515 [Marinilabiliales bacterium]